MNVQVKQDLQIDKERRVKRRFSTQEDTHLCRLVAEYGPDWYKIAESMSDRSARQCRDRWVNYLSPNINHDPFSPEEDRRLLRLVAQLGTHWRNMVPHFLNRSETALRNRYRQLCTNEAEHPSVNYIQRLPPIDVLCPGYPSIIAMRTIG